MVLKKRADGDAAETAPLETEKPKSKRKSQESVIVYITLLFTVAFLLILLSYFTHSRENENTISSLTEEHSEFRLKAQQDIEELQSRNVSLSDEVKTAQARIVELGDRLAEQKQAADDQRKSDNEKYDELYKSLVAMDRLIDLEEAFRSGDEELIRIAFDNMEEYARYLDGAYAELYENMKAHPEDYYTPETEEIPAEEEEKNEND